MLQHHQCLVGGARGSGSPQLGEKDQKSLGTRKLTTSPAVGSLWNGVFVECHVHCFTREEMRVPAQPRATTRLSVLVDLSTTGLSCKRGHFQVPRHRMCSL